MLCHTPRSLLHSPQGRAQMSGLGDGEVGCACTAEQEGWSRNREKRSHCTHYLCGHKVEWTEVHVASSPSLLVCSILSQPWSYALQMRILFVHFPLGLKQTADLQQSLTKVYSRWLCSGAWVEKRGQCYRICKGPQSYRNPCKWVMTRWKGEGIQESRNCCVSFGRSCCFVDCKQLTVTGVIPSDGQGALGSGQPVHFQGE